MDTGASKVSTSASAIVPQGHSGSSGAPQIEEIHSHPSQDESYAGGASSHESPNVVMIDEQKAEEKKVCGTAEVD